MKIEAYLVEWSDDRRNWKHDSIHFYLTQAIQSAEQIPYPFRFRRVSVELGELASEDEYQEAKEINNFFKTIFHD